MTLLDCATCAGNLPDDYRILRIETSRHREPGTIRVHLARACCATCARRVLETIAREEVT